MRIYDVIAAMHERLKVMPQNEIESLRTEMRQKYEDVKHSDEFFQNNRLS